MILVMFLNEFSHVMPIVKLASSFITLGVGIADESNVDFDKFHIFSCVVCTCDKETGLFLKT